METLIYIGCGVNQKFEQFGKYLLLEKLATGGMAEVFLARANAASGISKVVAIKRILPQYADSPEFIDMFKDEARIALNLKHSNIVSIFDFGVQNKQFFLVMDYVEGRNLRQILNKLKKVNQRLSIDQVVYIIKEVAAGLDHAHRCIDAATGKPLNITHRDMSPQNVMISFESEVKIVDFGIAKAETQLETTRAGTLKGKFGYMSPEQAEGQVVDLRTDIFSLGIVLWELLANDRLFVASNEMNTLRKIRDCQIPSLRKINPNIPTELERIAMKALARDRNLRYQTASAMHRDLNRFLNRQYPEFSPQDFGTFIKNQFSDEIFSTRQRLVEYGKIPVQSQTGEFSVKETLIPRGPTEKGAGLSNTSSSFVHPMNQEGETPTNTGGKDGVQNQAAAPTGAATNKPDSFAGYKNPDFDFHNNPQAKPTGNEDATRVGNAAQAKILNDQALRREQTRVRVQMPGNPNQPTTDEPSQPSISSRSRVGTRSGIHRSQVHRSVSFPKSVPLYLAGFIIAIAGYAYLAKTQVKAVTPLVKALDPYVQPLHRVLGISGTQSIASTGEGPKIPDSVQLPTPEQMQIPQPALKPADVAPVADTKPTEVIKRPDPTSIDEDPEPLSDNEPKETILVTSAPSGAEILINGRPTGALTPSRVEVPASREFSITLRRMGFLDYRKTGLVRRVTGSRFSGTLQPALVGYLDIDVVPPQNAKVFINGRQLKGEHLPITGYAVPAETTVTIRAEDAIAKTSVEQTIKVPKDKRIPILLDLRRSGTKNDRQPSRNR